jgi:hypothetical protein
MKALRIILPLLLLANVSLAQSASSDAERAALTPDQLREDLSAFRTEFMARDRSYAPAARSQAEARLRELAERLDEPTAVTPVRFELALAQIAALADNAHTIVFPPTRARRYNRVPLRLATFGDDYRVLRAADANADLLGARLVSVDGHGVPALRDSSRTLVGGPPHRRDQFAPVLLESPEQLYAMGLARSAARATYVFQTTDGRTVSRDLAAEAPSGVGSRAAGTRTLFPAAPANDERGWRTLLPVTRTPWALADPDARFRWREAPEVDGMVIELRQIFNAPGKPIAEFLAEMTRVINERKPRHLVIDLRVNGGGNLNTARDFMKSVPSLIPGRIFALTSPWTFSAAISSLGYLEQAAPDRVTIVGEEVGDRLEFWAEGRPTTLPHSGIAVSFSTERHDYMNACRAFTDCHAPVVRNSIAVPTLVPDIEAPWTIEAYRLGRDPGMEAIVAELRRAR